MLDLRLELESDDGIIQTYAVERPGNPCMRRSLIYSPSTQSIVCSCKRFEFEGILCAHALKLYRELALSTLPSKYYLKRWRHDARLGVEFESHGKNASGLSLSSTVQYSHLSHITHRIVAKGARNKRTCTLVESKLLELEAELDRNFPVGQEHDETNGDVDFSNEVHKNNTNLVLRDPKVKKRGGRGKGKRKNILGSKKQSKNKAPSMLKEHNASSVPKEPNAPPLPKKRKVSSNKIG